MKSWFEGRGYPNKLIEQEKEKVKILKNRKRCEVCLNVNETFTFTSIVKSETYIINHKFNCQDKVLVYLFTCNCCKKKNTWFKQFDEFRFRWNNYKSNFRKHVWNNNHMSIFAAATIIVYKWCLNNIYWQNRSIWFC